MSRHPDFVPQGVIPAVLLPFHEDLSIDEPSFRAHLRDVAAVQGLSAITVNAHSTEVASCTRDEQRRVMEIASEEVGGKLPIVHGVTNPSIVSPLIRFSKRQRSSGNFSQCHFAVGAIPATHLARSSQPNRDGGWPWPENSRCSMTNSMCQRFVVIRATTKGRGVLVNCKYVSPLRWVATRSSPAISGALILGRQTA